MVDKRTDAEVEKTITDVLGDFANRRIGKGSAEQIKGAAESTIKEHDKTKALGEAIRNSGR